MAFTHFTFPFSLRIDYRLLTCSRHEHQGPCPSRFPLPTVTGVHRHEVHHYYGFICPPPSQRSTLRFRLVFSYPCLLTGRDGLPRISLQARAWALPIQRTRLLPATGPSTSLAELPCLIRLPRFAFAKSHTPPRLPPDPTAASGTLAYGLSSRRYGRRGLLSAPRLHRIAGRTHGTAVNAEIWYSFLQDISVSLRTLSKTHVQSWLKAREVTRSQF